MENNDYKKRILSLISETSEPLDIEKIRAACGIGNWNTALKHCLELVLEKKISGVKTSKSWIFWKPGALNAKGVPVL